MPEKVHVVVADYGLNGSEVLGVFRSPPDEHTVRGLTYTPLNGEKVSAFQVSGYSGTDVVECEVTE